jgi:carbon-monoxide dehydrogenase large subunit
MEAKWIGKTPLRREDLRFVTGRGQYTADVSLPNMLYAALLRSSHAHARLLNIDVSRAKEMQGVVEVLTGHEIKEIASMPLLFEAQEQKRADRPCLPVDKVRYVGEPIAIVAAEDPYLADDALERIEVEYDPLPPVVDVQAALEPDAQKLWEEWGDNIAAEALIGGGDVEAAFQKADFVISGTFREHRHFACPLEGRALVADYNPASGELTVWCATQGPYRLAQGIAQALGMPENKVRVIAKDVGGSFGVKFLYYSEDFLVPYLAKRLCRPVKWVENRREHFTSSRHCRELITEAEIAAKKDGAILGLRGTIYDDQGAGLENVKGRFAAVSVIGPYKIPAQGFKVLGIVTNKVPAGGYRGLGQQSGHWIRESLMDQVAAKIGTDPADIRFRNFIQPHEFPYFPPGAPPYDSGNYPAVFQKGLDAFGYRKWRARQKDLRSLGRLVGVGICCYTEMTGLGPSKMLWAMGIKSGGYVGGRVRVEPGGTVTLFTAMTSQGQGIETMLAQVCADQLGLELHKVKVVLGDSSECPPSGYQTGGSRGAVSGGASIVLAARKVMDKAVKIAAHHLEANENDLVYKDGKVQVKGSEEKFMTLEQISRAAYDAFNLPDGMEPGLDATCIYDPSGLPISFGAHFAAVEVDRETFQTKVLEYVIAHDCGVIINPANVEGQLIGSLCQVMGGVFSEELIYDETGQLLTTNLANYLLPRAADMPDKISIVHGETPSPLNPLGVKGMGEGGTIGAYGALAAAVKDALAPLGYALNELPLTSSKLYGRLKAMGALSPKN